MSEPTELIPKFTLDDFLSETPYQWLYERKDNKFMLQILLQKVQVIAKAAGFSGFMKTWNAYVESKSPRATIVGNNQTLFPNQPTQLDCGQYVADEYGISRLNEMGAEVEVLSHPLMPVKRVTNIESLEEKLEIAYCRGKDKWKHITVSRETLASAQKIIALSKQGVAVNSENAKEVVKYMGTLESLNYDDLPRQDSIGHMGWLPDGSFAPYAEKIAYDGESTEFARMYNDFQPTGSEEVWMDLIKKVRSGRSVPARIALAASFASPLVSICNALPFFVHLWGTQGCGKTVGLMEAASVWGNPTVGRYIKTFGGTKVSLELYAAFCGNMPILLDELQVISDRRMFDDIIYMLCEGVSKGRGAKEGGLQTQRRWSSCILTTGEMPIVQSNSGGGAAVRTIEVNYGGEPLFEDARSVANTLKENYGWAGRRFIQLLQNPQYKESLKAIQKKYYNALSGEIQDKQVLSASILLAADKLADLGIFKDGKALTVEEIKPYLITREEADVNQRCYQWLTGFIGANPRRFDSEDMNNGEVWGKIEDDHVFFIKSVFERVLKNEGYSAGAFLTWAKRNNLLKCENYGFGNKNNRVTCRKTFNKVATVCVGIRLLDPDPAVEEKKEYEGFIETNPPDLPF